MSEHNSDFEKVRAFISQLAPVADRRDERGLRERCHLLVTAADDAIRLAEALVVQWRAPDILVPLHLHTSQSGVRSSTASFVPVTSQAQERALRDILKIMAESVTACTRMQLGNCGAFIELPWLRSLVAVYQRAYAAGRTPDDVAFTMNPYMQRVFVSLLSALRQSGEADLLDGTDVWKDFAALTALLRRPGMSPDVQSEVCNTVPCQRHGGNLTLVHRDVLDLSLNSFAWTCRITRNEPGRGSCYQKSRRDTSSLSQRGGPSHQ